MSQNMPQICQLAHAGFRMLGQPVFRLSEGVRVPSMVIQLEKQDVVLPLRSVAREFRIDAASADGRMLNLIEHSLDFVVGVKLGDKLPLEINGDEPNWDPSEQDRRVALSRVRHNLVRCVFAALDKTFVVSGGVVPGWEDEPKNQALLRQAVTGAAAQIHGSDEADITMRVASIGGEMAYIENMRRTMTRGTAGLREKLLQINIKQAPAGRQETVVQVQVLARRGLAHIMRRFNEVDSRFDDVLAVLRDMPGAIAWLRGQRDWLFRSRNAWEEVFGDWARAPNHFDDFLWKVLERTYVFLAPRFMSFQDWEVKDAKLRNSGMQARVW
jgi:hypothetical protein